MNGVFGGYTRWAVVFLIIFVLFFLFVPMGAPMVGATHGGVAVTTYTKKNYVTEGYVHPGSMGQPGQMGGMYGSSYESESSM